MIGVCVCVAKKESKKREKDTIKRKSAGTVQWMPVYELAIVRVCAGACFIVCHFLCEFVVCFYSMVNFQFKLRWLRSV